MWHATSPERTQGGFTLLEILVALAIFAAASLIAYSGLHAVISTKTALDREIRFWRELGQVFDRMEADFVQVTPHLFRDEKGETYPPLRGKSTPDDGFFIELSRYDENRIPVRAAYRCNKGTLDLNLMPITPRRNAEASTPTHALLKNIERCDMAYLGKDNTWASAWPDNASAIKPRAIRIRLTMDGRGQFERIYYLP